MTDQERKKKKKKRESELLKYFEKVMEQSLKKTLDKALDDIFKDWKENRGSGISSAALLSFYYLFCWIGNILHKIAGLAT